MALWRGTAEGFERASADGTLFSVLQRRFKEALGYPAQASEVRSWEASLPRVAEVLLDSGLHKVEVLVEHGLPLTSKRIDVLVLGCGQQREIGAVIVENKQWTVGDIDDIESRIVTVLGRRSLHPQEQVAKYAAYLEDFHPLHAAGELEVHGCAFLHNATTPQIAPLRDAALTDVAQYPLFSGDDLAAMRAFLTKHLKPADPASSADRFLTTPPRAAKTLLRHVNKQVRGQPEFTLLDEQQVAFQVVMDAVHKSHRSNVKTVVAIIGGPGTGKSVIALELLAALAARGRNVSHATGSKAFTETLRHRVGSRAGQVFRYFNNFTDADANGLDVLVADEAHRIRETSNSRFTPKVKRSAVPQVDELIEAARVPVFLLDERQVVRPGETGTVEGIAEAAERAGARLETVDLNGQFRSAGSEAYILWVESLLGLDGGSPAHWLGEEDPFELVVLNSPEELDEWVRASEAAGRTARMTAGFCWPWSDPLPDGTLVDDIVIGSWKRPWNARPGKKVVGAPPASLWASDPAGIDQVGCIYTAQGFEYDHGAVLFGPDLVRRDGTWVTDPTASYDTVVKRSKEKFPQLVRQTYKVLLSRGLVGCAIHSIDPETNEFLHSLV